MQHLDEQQLNQMSKEELVSFVLKMQEQNLLFLEQLAVAQTNQFGRRSEKMVSQDQLSVFDECETVANPAIQEPTIEEVITYTRKKSVGKREEDLKGLPVHVVNHEMEEQDLVTIFGENNWKRLPDQVYRNLQVHPAIYEVYEHHIAVYAAKNQSDKIIKAPHPKELLNNSIATPSLVAAILNGKYTNAMPLYRIAQEFKNNDVSVSRQTMANWVISCCNLYLNSVYEAFHKELLKRSILQADETPVIVSKDKTTKTGKSYMWVYRTGSYDDEKPIVMYEYQKSRATEIPEKFLGGFKGTLVCDGYSAYHKLGDMHSEIKIANCYAHARRHFAKAVETGSKVNDSRLGHSLAQTALNKIGVIYAEDEKLNKLTPEERYKQRQASVKPLVEDFLAWVHKHQTDVLPKSETGKGFTYCINQEKYLKTFLEDGQIPMDNSASERAIRPFTIGRKNWVMIDTKAGAQSSAIAYSIVETAKANHLKPYEYFKWLLEELSQHADDTDYTFVENLLPWSDKIPDKCKKAIQ